MRDWTQEERRLIFGERGLRPASQIAGEYGVSRNAIIGLWFRERRAKGTAPMRKLGRCDPYITNMTNWGWSVAEIAEAVGFSIPGVYLAQKRLGLRKRA